MEHHAPPLPMPAPQRAAQYPALRLPIRVITAAVAHLGQAIGQQPHRELFRLDQHLRPLQRNLRQRSVTAVALAGTADLAEILVQQGRKGLAITPHLRRMQRAFQRLQFCGQHRIGRLAGTVHGGSWASTCGAVGLASGTHCPGCATRYPRAANAWPSATLA
ncbi:hypothetical protein G6F22_008398 [Rhizopus arrhizus]|nr:hypothetical protein G6F22_008398 [Rhizopus arrhizus]